MCALKEVAICIDYVKWNIYIEAMFSDSLVTIMDVAVSLECKYFNYIIQLYNDLVEFQHIKEVSTILIDGLCVLPGFDM